MAGQDQADVEAEQSLQGGQIIGHVAVGRMNHRGALPENIIAAEQDFVAAFVKAAVAGFVARGVQHVQFAAAESNPVVVVVLKILAAEIAFARPMDAELGARTFSQRHGPGAVIAVDVGDQYLFDLLGAHRLDLLDDAVEVRIGA